MKKDRTGKVAEVGTEVNNQIINLLMLDFKEGFTKGNDNLKMRKQNIQHPFKYACVRGTETISLDAWCVYSLTAQVTYRADCCCSACSILKAQWEGTCLKDLESWTGWDTTGACALSKQAMWEENASHPSFISYPNNVKHQHFRAHCFS